MKQSFVLNPTHVKPRISVFPWLLGLVGDYLWIAFAFFIAYKWKWPAYPFSVLILGIAQHRLSVLGHEGVHGLISRNKHVNYWLGQLFCFWPLLTDLKSYRAFHLAHHRHTGNESLDPEFEPKEDRYHFPRTRAELTKRFFLDLCGASFSEFLKVTVYFSKRDNPIWAPSFIILGALLSYYVGHIEFFILFMIAKPTAFWAVFRLRIYTEHTDIPGTHRVHLAVWQRLLFSPHNIGIHWEHHTFPNIPFWQLRALRYQYEQVPVISFERLLEGNRVGAANNNVATASASERIEAA